MYHVELRQFPHNFCRFNLTDRELRATILDAWARGDWIELGERKWSPHQASLTILEGPRLPVEQLSMGRGWRNASRHGQDVTERLLAAVRAGDVQQANAQAAAESGLDAVTAAEDDREMSVTGRPDVGRDARLVADSLGLEALSRLAGDPAPIALAWRIGRERYPDSSAGDCLRLAELAVGSLAQARLVVLFTGGIGDELRPLEPGAEVELALLEIDAWGSAGESATVLMRRA